MPKEKRSKTAACTLTEFEHKSLLLFARSYEQTPSFMLRAALLHFMHGQPLPTHPASKESEAEFAQRLAAVYNAINKSQDG
jgi:hypothetical protein